MAHRFHANLTIILAILLLTSLPQTLAGDITPPTIITTHQSAQVIRTEDSITLSAQAMDDTSLDTALLITNETGTWQARHSWYDSHWTRSIKLTITHVLTPKDLTNFTFLASITNTDFITNAQADGDDFIFVDPTNTTHYPYEIDTYNPDTGSLTAWVRIPRLRSFTDTTVYLYYGNLNCTSQQDPARLWTGYLLVHHFTGTSLYDSSGHQTTQAVGSPIYNATGVIGTSITLNTDDNDDHLYTPTFRLLEGTSYTVMAWIARSESRVNRSTIVQGIDSGQALQVTMDSEVQSTAATTYGYFFCNSSTKLSITPYLWYAVCGRVDVRTRAQDIFINGSLDASSTFTGSVLPEFSGLLIGVNVSNWRLFHGRLDELRIFQGSLNDSWISSEYKMIRSPQSYLIVGPVKTEPDQRSFLIRLEETTQPQWANFTWSNPQVRPGITVGWCIVFRDLAGNQNQTPTQNFKILELSPLAPSPPNGPSWATVNTNVTFSVVTTDPDEGVISYLIDFGDGTSSNWTAPEASGVSQYLTHHWLHPGVYFVKVQARGDSGILSEWSQPVSIVIMESTTPSLMISVPAAVVERTNYTVSVTANGVPVPRAVVQLMDLSLTTNDSGEIGMIAPSVDRSQSCLITASHESFQSAAATMIIVRKDSSTLNGWIYGNVSSLDGTSLSGVSLSAKPVNGTLNHCVLSDSEGRYTLSLAPGSYFLEAGQAGYEQSRQVIVVNGGQALHLDMVLSVVQHPNPSLSSNTELMETVIEAGIMTNTIAGRLDISADDASFFSAYDEGFTAWMLHQAPGDLSFVVSGSNRSGTVFAIRLVSHDEPAGVRLWIDDADVTQVRLGEILQRNGDVPAYATSVEKHGDETVVYCLVFLPHWSTHTIQIQNIASMVSSGAVLVFYVVIAVLVGFGVVLPIVAIERKRR
jgi:hypothetical protein